MTDQPTPSAEMRADAGETGVPTAIQESKGQSILTAP